MLFLCKSILEICIALPGHVLPLSMGFPYGLREVHQTEVFNQMKEVASQSSLENQGWLRFLWKRSSEKAQDWSCCVPSLFFFFFPPGPVYLPLFSTYVAKCSVWLPAQGVGFLSHLDPLGIGVRHIKIIIIISITHDRHLCICNIYALHLSSLECQKSSKINFSLLIRICPSASWLFLAI